MGLDMLVAVDPMCACVLHGHACNLHMMMGTRQYCNMYATQAPAPAPRPRRFAAARDTKQLQLHPAVCIPLTMLSQQLLSTASESRHPAGRQLASRATRCIT